MSTPLLVGAYLGAIVTANLTTAAFGASAMLVNAGVLIGLDLVSRDHLHQAWHGRWLWPRMAALIAAGSLLSAALSWQAAQVALASCVAFACAGVVDALTYHVLRARWLRVNGSNVLSAAVDSVIFPALAFGSLSWQLAVTMWLVKTAGGAVWWLVLGGWRDLPQRRGERAGSAGRANIPTWADAPTGYEPRAMD